MDVIWLFFGCGSVIAFFILSIQALRVKKWKSTLGKVIDVKIVGEQYGSDHAGFIKKVYYTYEVDGEKFTSNKIDKGMLWHSWNRWTAEDSCGEYKIGNTVTVYYNPKKPTDAILDPRYPWELSVYLIIGVLIIVLCWV